MVRAGGGRGLCAYDLCGQAGTGRHEEREPFWHPRGRPSGTREGALLAPTGTGTDRQARTDRHRQLVTAGAAGRRPGGVRRRFLRWTPPRPLSKPGPRATAPRAKAPPGPQTRRVLQGLGPIACSARCCHPHPSLLACVSPSTSLNGEPSARRRVARAPPETSASTRARTPSTVSDERSARCFGLQVSPESNAGRSSTARAPCCCRRLRTRGSSEPGPLRSRRRPLVRGRPVSVRAARHAAVACSRFQRRARGTALGAFIGSSARARRPDRLWSRLATMLRS